MTDYEKKILEKIDNGQDLNEDELSSLVRNKCEIDRIEGEKGESRKWHKIINSIIQLGDRYFKIKWEQRPTRSQSSIFYHQPVEVKKHIYKRTITITKWEEVKKKG